MPRRLGCSIDAPKLIATSVAQNLRKAAVAASRHEINLLNVGCFEAQKPLPMVYAMAPSHHGSAVPDCPLPVPYFIFNRSCSVVVSLPCSTVRY